MKNLLFLLLPPLLALWPAATYAQRDSLSEQVLGEAQVTVERQLMVVRNDTVIYDPMAAGVGENDMLEQLLKALPGIYITDDGRIFLNGERVTQLLVNGRDLFKGNRNLAFENLPVYAMEKLKVYRKEADWAHLENKDNKDTRRNKLVLDVRLKREYSQGWLANFELAGGADIHHGGDGLYQGRLFAMRYNDRMGMTLYGNVNNVSDNLSPGARGEWKRNFTIPNERKVRIGGINLLFDKGKTVNKVRTNLEVRHEDALMLNRMTNVMYLSENNSVTNRMNMQNNATKTDVKWSGELTAKTKRTYFSVWPSVQYHRDRTLQASDAQDFADNGDGPEQVYARHVEGRDRNDTWQMGTSLDLMVKSPLSEKNYHVQAGVNYSHEDRRLEEADRIVRTALGETPGEELRNDLRPGMNYSYNASVKRNLADVARPGFTYNLDVSYRFMREYRSQRRDRSILADGTDAPETDETDGETNDADNRADTDIADCGPDDTPIQVGAATGLLPSAQTDRQWLTDIANSFRTAEAENRHDMTAQLRLSNNEKQTFNLQLQLSFAAHRRTIRDVHTAQPAALRRKDFIMTPMLNIYFHGFGLFYYAYRQLPDMSRLIDVRDNRDPLYVSLGNPGLKPSQDHYLRLSYRLPIKNKHQSYGEVSVGGSTTRRAIGYASLYDAQTGVTTSQPLNINGNRRLEAQGSYGQTLDKKGHLRFSASTRFDLKHSVDFANDGTTSALSRSAVDNYTVNSNISLSYNTRKGFRIEAKGSHKFLKQTSDRKGFTTNRSTDYSYGLAAGWKATKRFELESDIMVYARTGYSNRDMNTTDWVWNASASYAFGKKKEWVVRAMGFDLLHQLSTFQRQINEQGYIEMWNNTISSYAMLSLVYHLNIKPRKPK